jgi:hypothetical protein
MTDAVTAGCFSDFKLVKTRKVAQFVIELPLERADEALELLGGLPRPDREVWVAIARLKSDPFTNPAPPDTEPEPVAAPEEQKERRRITELPFSQRAAMLVQDRLFIDFLRDRHADAVTAIEATNWTIAPQEVADQVLKGLLGIQSKRDLNTDHDAAERFDRLSRAFWQWKQEPVSPAA